MERKAIVDHSEMKVEEDSDNVVSKAVRDLQTGTSESSSEMLEALDRSLSGIFLKVHDAMKSRKASVPNGRGGALARGFRLADNHNNNDCQMGTDR